MGLTPVAKRGLAGWLFWGQAFPLILAVQDPGIGTCSEPGTCGEVADTSGGDINQKYFWPHGKGHPHHFGKSPYAVTAAGPPCNFSASLRWKWHHPGGRYRTLIMGAPVIDDKRNVYLCILSGIKKFSPDGQLIWSWDVYPNTPEEYTMDMPAIMDGLLFVATTDAVVHAVDMEHGRLVWNTKVDTVIGGDNGFVTARDGRVFVDAGPQGSVPNKVVCLNGTDGQVLWEFKPDVGVWNFLPLFPLKQSRAGGDEGAQSNETDGTMVFQTFHGAVYRLNCSTGAQIWRGGPPAEKGTFTDGGAAIGPNNVVYAVTSLGEQEAQRSTRGGLHAFNVSDGKLLWEHTSFQAGLYTYPVVAQLHEAANLSVVTGVGSLGGYPYQMAMQHCCGYFLRTGAAVGFGLRACDQVRRSFFGGKKSSPFALLRSFALWSFWWALLVGSFVNLYYVNSVMPTTFPYNIYAFNAETGALEWRVDLPTYHWPCCAGDEAGYLVRSILTPWRPVALPCASSYPTVDARGVIYFVHLDGKIYSIKDWNGDGTIDKKQELCSFDAGASGFTGGPSIAPGMLAVSTTDTLYVFGD